MYTRREFGQLTLAGLAVPLFGGLVDSTVGGVRLGVQTYSFRDLPRPQDGDVVDVVIKAMTECGLSECELFAPQVEPRLGPAGGRGAAATPEVAAGPAEGASRISVPGGSARHRPFPRDQEKVRRRRHLDLRLQLQLQRRHDRRGDRPRLRDGQGARRRHHHGVHEADGCEARRAVRRQAPDDRGDARALEPERSERVLHARELCRGDEDVEALQGQSRHRSFHRGRLRPRRVHPRASRRHHEPAPQGS